MTTPIQDPKIPALDQSLQTFSDVEEKDTQLGEVLAQAAAGFEEVATDLDEGYLAQLEEGLKEMDEISKEMDQNAGSTATDDVRKKLSQL